LGTSVDAVRKRIARGTLESEKVDGKVYVLLDDGAPRSDSEALISSKDETIAVLREQLEAERQAHAEARRLLMAALERIPPQIEAPQEPPESPETVEEEPERAEPRPATGGTQTGAQRPWWRRIFSG